MKKEILWPVDFHTHTVDFPEERNYLLNLLEDFKEIGWGNVSGQRSNTTINGYQPDQDILSISHEMIDRITDKIVNPISNEFWKSISEGKLQHFPNINFIHKGWLVEYGPGTYQNLHVHKSSLFTAIWTIYKEPQAPDAGELHIHNPLVESWTMGFYPELKKVTSEVDEIVIFPAWLPHNVTPTTARRVVFVWDTLAIPKND